MHFVHVGILAVSHAQEQVASLYVASHLVYDIILNLHSKEFLPLCEIVA